MRHHADAHLTAALLRSIRFLNFRNLADAAWRPGEGPHILLGANGAGKTSLLEAVYLLATTRSFRTARLEECCRRDAESFTLNGVVETETRDDLAVGWSRNGRWRRHNEKQVGAARYLEALPVVGWSARDLKIIEGAPENRRRFLDQGIVNRKPAAVEILSRYRRAVEQKRELLRRGARQRIADLDAWNELLADASFELFTRRSEFIEVLERRLGEIIEASSLDVPRIELRYRPSPSLDRPSAAALLEAFESMRDREIEERRVLLGPHRDDMEILWRGVEASKIASAGEKKILGILLCAARSRVLTELGRQPIVLLDDIDAELDRTRLGAAWELFGEAPQVIASSCHGAVVEKLPGARVWRLESGSLTAA